MKASGPKGTSASAEVSPKEVLRSRLLGLGFDVVRFARVDSLAPGAEALRAWLAAGMHADMAWMARAVERREDPRQVLEGTATLVALGVNYHRAPHGKPGSRPDWASYSLYRDYHDTIIPALRKADLAVEEILGLGPEDHRYYVDTGPVLERSWAARAGMGFIGKNAMLISRDFGNWLFLSAILVRAPLEEDKPLRSGEKRGVGALCGKCTHCLDACPTRAITAPGVLDARLCIAYHTIENKGTIPESLRPMIGSHVYGCDICAEVCPWNRFSQDSRSVLLEARAGTGDLSIGDLLDLDLSGFLARFRGTPIKRIKLEGLLRNACVVAGNSCDLSLLPKLREQVRNGSVLVREHAQWAVRRLEALSAGDRSIIR